VAVSARPASNLPLAAGAYTPDLHTEPGVRAGTVPWDGPVATGWHLHLYHQVEYALTGVAEVETPTGRYLLPPQQAIWIPAGLPHKTTLHEVRSVSVFFDPSMMKPPADRARVRAAAPVIREMIAYGARWPLARPAGDATADAYFDVLASLVLEWLDQETPLWLPVTADPVIAGVMDYTNRHLDTVTAAAVCRAVGLSERTLRRRFPAETGMTWRAYARQSRLLRAMALLAERDRSVIEVATAVGFDSASAFTRAFQRQTGESPSAYRKRASSFLDRRGGRAPAALATSSLRDRPRGVGAGAGDLDEGSADRRGAPGGGHAQSGVLRDDLPAGAPPPEVLYPRAAQPTVRYDPRTGELTVALPDTPAARLIRLGKEQDTA
jgi:AraC-like DNA-binding protein